MTIRKVLLVLFLALASTTLFSQTAKEKEQIKRKRLRTIDLYHINVGLDAHFNQNLFFSPKASFGIGSFRHILNADVGIRYTLGGSAFFGKEEYVMVHQLPIFISAQCNFVSWETGCVFIGAEIAYHIPITGLHYVPSTSTLKFDNQLNQAHFSGRAKAGARINQWEIGLFYEYDLAPMMDQKHVYESPEYDYDILHDYLFERIRYGISLGYNFIL